MRGSIIRSLLSSLAFFILGMVQGMTVAAIIIADWD